ncbi:tetratricopeptide repeat protein [Nesterenkonia sp. MY13]|uniref:Tetratricopeptide repeat protein n=1 Tax=Nesterenkonia sedimenti TaxID=1463632 RepID=A0A7X8YEW6_9MICC|nr:tetratricopeptide repeat protein [Nesterenkonia sedimenti]NLS10930.1 tetratricopeptide repeat protein [Nesterenkonia sedimenti]
MVKPLILGAELARRMIRTTAQVPGLDVALARSVAASGRAVTPRVEASLTGGRSPVGAFHEKVATVLFEANRPGAKKLLDQINVEEFDDAEALERYALRFVKLKEYEAGLAMRQRAVELEPENPLRWVALARSLQRASWGAVSNDPVAGLDHGPVSDTEAAREALATAQELAPENAFVIHERGKLEFERGDIETGLQLMRQAAELEPKTQWWTDLAAAYRKPHIAELDKSLDAYEKALELKPSSPTAFRGVVIMGSRADQDWQRLWANAEKFEAARKLSGRRTRAKLMKTLRPMFATGATRAQISAGIVQLGIAHIKRQRLSWPTTNLIIYRLQFAQRMKTGFDLRRGLARRTIDWLGTNSAGHSRHRQKLLAALIYLERYAEAQALIDPMPWEPGSRNERHRLEKLAADTHFIQGRLQPLVDYAKARAEDLPLPGEEKFRSLIAGKRVAVVGPADTGDRLGEQIDGYDVVIRPRLMTEFDAEQAARLGTRTDISYFSGRDLAEFTPVAAAAVERGELQMVVGRGLSLNSFTEEIPDWLRFYRHDFSLGFHGPPMGIGRILYDVLQFEPAEVGLFNIDFFSGQTAFGAGYREDKDSGLGPYSIVNEIILAHDLAFEHRLTKIMASTGVLTGYGVAGSVLDLSEDQYIQKLEESPALITRGG